MPDTLARNNCGAVQELLNNGSVIFNHVKMSPDFLDMVLSEVQGWETGPPYMDGNCEYIESAASDC
jgi:hypothetical protein